MSVRFLGSLDFILQEFRPGLCQHASLYADIILWSV